MEEENSIPVGGWTLRNPEAFKTDQVHLTPPPPPPPRGWSPSQEAELTSLGIHA